MKNLDKFFDEKINSNQALTINGGSGGGPSYSECHEDTYGSTCDEYVQLTDDDGQAIFSYTEPKDCPPA